MNKPVVIVTGSSSGVGAATAVQIAISGWDVLVNYQSNREGAESTAEQCRKQGAEVLVCQADVGEDDDCRAMVQQVQQKWGRLDALVNNAGTTVFNNHANLEGLSADDFLRLYRVNTVGAYQMVRAAESLLRASERASVVNVASIAGVMGVGSSVAYAASKGALLTMTLSLARALGPIRINAVCPGFIQGDWLRQGLGDKAYQATRAAIEQANPLGVTSTAESVASAICYFVESAVDVTGETLILDGGSHLGGATFTRR